MSFESVSTGAHAPTANENVFNTVGFRAPADNLSGVSVSVMAVAANGNSLVFNENEKNRKRFFDAVVEATHRQIQQLDIEIDNLLDEREDLINDIKDLKDEVDTLDQQINTFEEFLDGGDPEELAKKDENFRQWYEQQKATGQDPKKNAEIEFHTLLINRDDTIDDIREKLENIRRIDKDLAEKFEQRQELTNSEEFNTEEFEARKEKTLNRKEAQDIELENIDLDKLLSKHEATFDLDANIIESDTVTSTNLSIASSRNGQGITSLYNAKASGETLDQELDNELPAAEVQIAQSPREISLEDLSFN